MTRDDETLMAAAAIIQGLAKDIPPSTPLLFNGCKTPQPPTNGLDVAKIKLPGAESDGKVALERELSSLVRRVNTMQSYVVSSLALFSSPVFCLFYRSFYSLRLETPEESLAASITFLFLYYYFFHHNCLYISGRPMPYYSKQRLT